MSVRSLMLIAATLYCLGAPSDHRGPRGPVVRLSAFASSVPTDQLADVVFSCPMDPDVRSYSAGKCRRCGMELVPGVPEPVEFHTDVTTIPAAPAAGRLAVLQFAVHDPWKDQPVSAFHLVHERLFHAFIVSQDLEFFEHGHPLPIGEGVFQYAITFPRPGMYRVLGDFYPSGGTPQLASNTVIVPGDAPPLRRLTRDYEEKTAINLRVSLDTVPDHPTATTRTQLRLRAAGPFGLEKYLGVWGHLLVASSDLIDMMHEHPFLADGGERVEFELVFPRPGSYRIWVQFQSHGVVNTAHFDVPVDALE
jgi:Heavy metal binding domain